MKSQVVMVLITDNQETELKIAYTTEFTINSFEYIDKNNINPILCPRCLVWLEGFIGADLDCD